MCAVISVRHGDAGDAVASPTLEHWPLVGQKFSTFGQIIQLHSLLREVDSMLPSTAQVLLRLILPFFASDGKIDCLTAKQTVHLSELESFGNSSSFHHIWAN